MLDYYDGIKIIQDKRTGSPIGVEWKYEDGTTYKYYPDNNNEEWFINFVDDVRKEHNLSRKERNHCEVSIDNLLYEGLDYADNETPVYFLDIGEQEKEVDLFLSMLSDVQKRRLKLRLENPKLSFQKIADIEGVSKTGIAKTFMLIRETYLKYVSMVN